MTMSKASNLVIYSPIKYQKPQLATKSLIINKQGKRDKINHFKNGYLGNISVQQFQSFNEFSKLLIGLESNPYAFILRGSIRDGVDLSKPYPRRKALEKYEAKGQGHTVAFKESNEGWLGFDIDKMPLDKVGITKPINELDIKLIIQLIISTYAPELANVSCHYQLSSSCGWTDSTSISCHLFFVLKNPLSNPQAKLFAQAVNARAGFELFDTALYQAVQPHFTAAPIIVAPAIDPIAGKRSGQLRYADDYLDFDIDKLLLDSPQNPTPSQAKPRKAKKSTSKKTKAKPLYKPVVHNISTLDGWLKHFETIENLHNEVRSFSNWLYSQKFWGLTPATEKKVFAALRKSPRIKNDPTRLALFISEGEYKDLMDSARERQLQKRIERYRLGLLKPDLVKNFKWLSDGLDFEKEIKPLMGNKKIVLVDAPMGNGKTTWAIKNFFGNKKKYDSPTDTSVAITLLRFLALQWAKAARMDDYELVKKLSRKDKQDEGVFNLSVCLNSIINEGIADFLPENPQLFMDEIDATLRAIFGGTITGEKPKAVLEQLKALFDDASLVVLMQHNITDLTLTFLEYLGYTRDDIFLVKNTYQRYAGLPCYYHQSEDGLIEELHKAIGSGEHCFIACNSKAQVEKIMAGLKKAFPNLPGLSITSDNSKKKDQAAFLENPTKESKKYSYIVYSPSMSTGVSIENPLFSRTFGFFNSLAGNAPSDCAQMLMRSRTAKRIDYYVDSRLGQKYDKQYFILLAMAQFDWIHNRPLVDDFGNVKQTPETTALLQLEASKIEKEHQEKADFVGNLYADLKGSMGMNVQLIATGDAQFEQGKAIKKESKEEVAVTHKAKLLQAQKVTPSQFELLDEQDDQATLPARRRFKFENVMRLDIESCPKFEPTTDNLVSDFANYEQENPEVSQALNDYQDGRIKKKHLFLSEASTPASEARQYARHIADSTPEPKLKMATYKSFWIRWHLFQLLLPLVGLKVVNWQLQPIDGFSFVYANILANKPLMDFCSKHALALQGCGLTKFKGKRPTADTIGKWLGDMGLNPKFSKKRDKGQRVKVFSWDNRLDVPTTRLLSKYNAIQDKVSLIQAIIGNDKDQVEPTPEQASNDGNYPLDDDEFSYMNEEGYQIYTWGYKS
jgi:hypothetical protein